MRPWFTRAHATLLTGHPRSRARSPLPGPGGALPHTAQLLPAALGPSRAAWLLHALPCPQQAPRVPGRAAPASNSAGVRAVLAKPRGPVQLVLGGRLLRKEVSHEPKSGDCRCQELEPGQEARRFTHLTLNYKHNLPINS